VKTIRRLKIQLTSREILVSRFDKENARDEPGAAVCPLCHLPLSVSDALASAVAALPDSTEADTKEELNDSETKKSKDKKE
jgi:hypothetical protein